MNFEGVVYVEQHYGTDGQSDFIVARASKGWFHLDDELSGQSQAYIIDELHGSGYQRMVRTPGDDRVSGLWARV